MSDGEIEVVKMISKRNISTNRTLKLKSFATVEARHRVPGTTFIVDGFRYKNAVTNHYFLTHYHSDHFCGVTKCFNLGKIVCSPLTASLLQKDFRVTDQNLVIVLPGSSITLEGVLIHVFDANHCPGSLMFVFHVKKQTYVHTGDFRFEKRKMQQFLDYINNYRVRTVFLDCTYLLNRVAHPPQNPVCNFLLNSVRFHRMRTVIHKDTEVPARPLFVIGAYTIGKERLVEYLIKHEAIKEVFLTGEHRRIVFTDLGISHIYIELDISHNGRGVTYQGEYRSDVLFTNLKDTSYVHAQRLLEFFPQFNQVISYQPSGWSYVIPKRLNQTKERYIFYKLPYSEHCASNELTAFVNAVNPKYIVPITECDPVLLAQLKDTKKRQNNCKTLHHFFSNDKKKRRKSEVGEKKQKIIVL
ncbi:hypothetical protein PCE1_004049 [Barthelona sp. PCE]